MVSSEGKLLIANVIAFMETKLDASTSMKQICVRFSISQSHLSHLFKKVCGISPMKFMVFLRIDKAKVLLKNSSLMIHEIAYSLNFADSSYFCRVFKKVTGMTPSEYRYSSYVEENENVRPQKSKNRYRADCVDRRRHA